jgi:hypothetical protein
MKVVSRTTAGNLVGDSTPAPCLPMFPEKATLRVGHHPRL